MIRLVTLFVALFAACLVASAGVIDVTYTVSGSPGAWDLNFTVANNMTAWPFQDIYQFGVKLSVPGIIGSPAGYDPTVVGSLTNLFNGGQPIFYNNIWYDGTFLNLSPGMSLSGFIVEVPDDVAPSSVSWFAYSYPTTGDSADFYTGSDAFNPNVDGLGSAGFEGLAASASSDVPEPSTFGLLVIGLGAGVFLRRNVVRA